MAMDQKRLQKKKAKRAAKTKQRKVKQKAGIGTKLGVNASIRMALNAPVYECWESDGIFQTEGNGIGTVIVSRKTPGNDILIAFFLVDAYCLGVKNAYMALVPKTQYEEKLDDIRQREPLSAIHPSCARKLVEGAENYARNLGFSPHKDYLPARKIFGDIEAESCPRSFAFGKDGKPFYIAGPNDGPAFVKTVIKKLTDKCGPDGFHFLSPMEDFDL